MRQRANLFKKYTDPKERHKPPSKRKRFKWQLRWWDAAGKRHARIVADGMDPEGKWKAQDALRDKLQEIEQSGGFGPVETSFDVFIEDHLAVKQARVRPTTLKEERKALETFNRLMEPGTLQAVDFAMAERFQKLLAEEPVMLQTKKAKKGEKPPTPKTKKRAKSTTNKYLRSLHAAFEAAVNRELIRVNPFAKVKQQKTSKRDWHRYPDGEVAALMKHANPEMECFVWLAYTTGLRRGELEHLRFADIDFEARTVKVQEREAKGRVLAWSPKDTDLRTLSIDDTAVAMLREIQVKRQATSPYVFVSGDRLDTVLAGQRAGEWGSLSRILNNVGRTFRDLKARAGISQGTIHELRKSCITNWLEAGIPPHEVQAMAGHADIKTTIEYYSKVDRGALDRARNVTETIAARVVHSA